MIAEKRTSLRHILESSEGIHLTAYLVNRGNIDDLKVQLKTTLEEAYEWLHSVLTIEERKKFLEPIESLLNDVRIINGMKGNIGIFRTKDIFRVLNVPVELERQCHVASSFHVKPLLRWLQSDREFLLLGMSRESATLYHGSRFSIKKINSVHLPDALNKIGNESAENGFSRLAQWINNITAQTKPRLFLAGERFLTDGLTRHLVYENLVIKPLSLSFEEQELPELVRKIREGLNNEVTRNFEQALLEFRFADEANQTRKNIFHIAKAAVQGRVRKLIVADGINVFGKVDKETGGLVIHPFDLDHEDDDILDDLAQTVLAKGGEVVVAPRDEIPKGRPALAILESERSEVEKIENVWLDAK